MKNMNIVKGFSEYTFSLLQVKIQDFLNRNKNIEIISISNIFDPIPRNKPFNTLIIYKELENN